MIYYIYNIILQKGAYMKKILNHLQLNFRKEFNKKMNKKYYYCFNKETKTWVFLENKENLLEFIGSIPEKYIIRNASLDVSENIFGTYVFYDKNFEIFDVRDFEEDFNKYFKTFHYKWQKKQCQIKNKKHGDIIYIKEIYPQRKYTPYAFRKDPVPNLRKYRSYKIITNTNYRRIIAILKNPEKKDFLRYKNYESLVKNAYDYEYDFHYGRKDNKSWKSKKIKHQWEKNKKKS